MKGCLCSQVFPIITEPCPMPHIPEGAFGFKELFLRLDGGFKLRGVGAELPGVFWGIACYIFDICMHVCM